MQAQRFVAEYVKDWHGTKAAIRAGYSAKSAANRASLLLAHPEVKAYIDACKAAVKERLHEHVALASEHTLRVIADVAYFDPRRFVHKDGSTKNLHELDDQSALAVAGFKTTEQWVTTGKTRRKVVQTEYRLVNRVAALDMAAKVTGEYAKDNEQRRNAREMTDDEIRARLLTLMSGRDDGKSSALPTLQ